MADLRQFANIPTTGIPNAPVQQFAADKSDAIRTQGTQQLLESTIAAGSMGFQAVDTSITNQRVQELVGDSADIPGMVENPANLTGDEASFLNFQQIANARRQGLSADRAKTAASTRLQQAIARDPRRADAYRAAFTNYFGGSGGATFNLTDMEKAQEEVIDYGLREFGLDPRLAQADPQAWERKFQANQALRLQQQEADRMLKAAEAGQKLSKIEQQSVFPQVVSGFITNPQSEVYIPSVVDSVLLQFKNESGSFDANAAVAAEQQLNVQLTSIEAQLRSQFSDLNSGDFESMFSPIEDYFQNAIAVANGEMSEAALIRENRIFQESATQALYQGNPTAARQWVGLSSIIGDLEVVPPTLQRRQEELGRLLTNSMPAILDPQSPVSAGDILSDTEYQNLSEYMPVVARAAANAANGDMRTRERAAEGITLVANELTANPEKQRANTYIEYFIATGRDEVLDTLSPEQLEAVQDSYSSDNIQKYLNDTLTRWQQGTRRPGVNLTYNPDTNSIQAVVSEDAPNRVRAQQDARRINREMGRTNIFFQSAQKVIGVSGEDILADNDIGKGILAISGIEVTREEPEVDFFDLPRGTPNRGRMEFISESILDGTATDSQIQDFQTILTRQPVFLENNIPQIRQAREALGTRLSESGRAAQVQGQQARATASRDARLTERVREIGMGGRNAPSMVGVVRNEEFDDEDLAVVSTIEEFESNESQAYVPQQNGSAIGNSGVTVGIGFDIGQRSNADIDNLDVSDELKAKLKPYTNLKRDSAIAAVEASPLELTDEELVELNTAVAKETLGIVRESVDDYSAIPTTAKSVLASLVHNFGPSATNFKTFEWIASGEYDKAIEELTDPDAWNNPELQARRNREAEMLRGIQ